MTEKEKGPISFDKKSKKYRVRIQFPKRKVFHLGYYKTQNEAAEIADKASVLISQGIPIEYFVHWINENTSRTKKISL